MLGLKDYQLRSPVTLSHAFRKVMLRSLYPAHSCIYRSAGSLRQSANISAMKWTISRR
jgi:hypothetical protein